jgi:deoxyribodipyrimidine photolyase
LPDDIWWEVLVGCLQCHTHAISIMGYSTVELQWCLSRTTENTKQLRIFNAYHGSNNRRQLQTRLILHLEILQFHNSTLYAPIKQSSAYKLPLLAPGMT